MTLSLINMDPITSEDTEATTQDSNDDADDDDIEELGAIPK